MTTEEILNEIEDYVSWCRSDGETDMRSVLQKITSLRARFEKENKGKDLFEGKPIMVFDVESIGLHGDGYAVGYVVIQGEEVESGMFACPASKANGAESDRLWVYENIPQLAPDSPDPLAVRENFWCRWMEWKAKGALLAADCAWPVEARFLAACVDASPDERRFAGPYPLVEISSVMMAVGIDPMQKHERLASELPVHNPVADARQSARLLSEALQRRSN